MIKALNTGMKAVFVWSGVQRFVFDGAKYNIMILVLVTWN